MIVKTSMHAETLAQPEQPLQVLSRPRSPFSPMIHVLVTHVADLVVLDPDLGSDFENITGLRSSREARCDHWDRETVIFEDRRSFGKVFGDSFRLHQTAASNR